MDSFAFNTAPFGPGASSTNYYNYISEANELYKLNTVSWIDPANDKSCYSQLDHLVPEDFHALGWLNYINANPALGFRQVCNTTTGVTPSTVTNPSG